MGRLPAGLLPRLLTKREPGNPVKTAKTSGPSSKEGGPTVFSRHAMNVDTMTDTARLTFEDKEVELPVVRGSEGEVGLDISKLRAQTAW